MFLAGHTRRNVINILQRKTGLLGPLRVRKRHVGLHSRWRYGPIAFLARCVPDLSLHRLAVHLNAARGKLNPDCALTLQVKFISGETGQQVTLSHTRVSNEDHWNREYRPLTMKNNIGQKMLLGDCSELLWPHSNSFLQLTPEFTDLTLTSLLLINLYII